MRCTGEIKPQMLTSTSHQRVRTMVDINLEMQIVYFIKRLVCVALRLVVVATEAGQ